MREHLVTFARKVRQSMQRMLRVAPLPAFALVLLAAMWSAVFYQIGVERHTSRTEAVTDSLGLARTLAEHVGHILREADHATQLFKLKFEESGGALRLREFTARNGLMASVLPTRLELPMAIIGKDGLVQDSANGFRGGQLAGRAFLMALREAPADAALFTTPPMDAHSGKWHIQVARRLNDRRGAFAGAIVILIDPAYFVDDYDRMNVDDAAALVLLSRGTGQSVGRAGERLFATRELGFAASGAADAPRDEIVASAPLDGIARIYSARDMPRFSLVAVVGIPERVAMARFERHRTISIWLTLAASTVIVAVVALLMKQSARLRASMRAAHEAQATLRAASDGSLDAVLIAKAWRGAGGQIEDFVIVDINDKGAAIAGMARAALLGKKVFALLPRYREVGFFERYIEVMQSGQPLEEERELRWEGGAPRWQYYQIVPLEDGVAVTVRDITERKQAELQIRKDRSFLQSLVEHLPLLIYVKSVQPDSFGTVMLWNRAAETVTGYGADVIGKVDRQAFAPGFALCNDEEDRAMLANPAVRDLPERPLLRPDGALRLLDSASVPLFDGNGQVEYILHIAQDVTLRRAQEQSLRTREAELAAVTDASPLGLVRADMQGNCVYANRMFETITGLGRGEAHGMGWLAALHYDDHGFLPEVFEHQRKTREPFARTLRFRHLDGKLVWAAVKIAAIRIGERIEGFAGSLDDITTLREAEMALRESEARLRTIADTMPAMVAYVDADQIYRFRNMAYQREFARSGIDVLGRSSRAIAGEQRYARLKPYILRALDGETLIFEEHDESGDIERTFEVTYIPQRGQDNSSVVGFHVMRQDISSQKRETKQLLKLAQVDALTGLINRAGFLQKLSEAMRASAEGGHLMAVMFMDIDRFKPVNDTYGHHVGDQLLKAFSARLSNTLRASDTIARLGGDEFTIIMEQIGRPQVAAKVAGKIVAAMRAPFQLDEVTVSVSTSIGLAFYRDGACGPETLLKQADALLYQAKEAGRNTYRAPTEAPAPRAQPGTTAEAEPAL